MYSTCLFCRSPLGANETFETFPVGRRLAYDAAKGRLWVVCPHCARWNLTPLEERWEAIDEAERRMERVRVRVSRGEVTLARLPEGTVLVRIGKPVPRELATWRWGDQLGRRRRRNLVVGVSAAALGGVGLLVGASVAGVAGLTGGLIGQQMRRIVTEGPGWLTVARLRAPDGLLLMLKPEHIRATSFGHTPAGEAEVTIRYDVLPGHRLLGRREPVTFTGAAAERALANLLPAANRIGGAKEDIDLALNRITAAKSPRHLIERLAQSRSNFTPIDDATGWERLFGTVEAKTGLYAMPTGIALALEMAVQEDRERAAMEGELAELEAAWREAEEVARIADDLFLPAEVTGRLEGLKRRLVERASG